MLAQQVNDLIEKKQRQKKLNEQLIEHCNKQDEEISKLQQLLKANLATS